MRTDTSYFKTFSKMMWMVALLLVVFTAGCDRDHGGLLLPGGDPGPAGAVNLGTASTFGIMATASITGGNAKTHIYGDVSLDPGTSITSLLAAQVSGTIHVNDAVSAQARADLLAAYNDLSTRPAPATVLTTPASAAGVNGGTFANGVVNLSGFVLLPGIYSVGLPSDTYALDNSAGPLVLDGGGNSSAVFIFQASDITTTSGDVILRNGARATNVYWVLTATATIGGGSFFQGTVVAGGDITAVLDANVQGRMLAGANIAGAIVLDGNSVVVPAP